MFPLLIWDPEASICLFLSPWRVPRFGDQALCPHASPVSLHVLKALSSEDLLLLQALEYYPLLV